MSKFDNQFQLDSRSGAALNVLYKKAKGVECGIVHINHGLAEYAQRYAPFAEALGAEGFHIYAHDHRGHGHTKAPDAALGIFSQGSDGISKLLDDCTDVQSHALANHPDLPLIMFGHSLGAIITMNYVLRSPQKLAGAAVWNTNFDAGILGRLAQILLAYERFRLGSDLPSRIIPKLTFDDWAKKIPNPRTNFDWLSHIDEEVDAYISDPLCGWNASVGMWRDIFEMVFYGGSPNSGIHKHAQSVPLHLIGGGGDPSTNFGKAMSNQAERLRNSGFKRVEFQIFPNARHETLKDLDAAHATGQFIDFAKSCCSE